MSHASLLQLLLPAAPPSSGKVSLCTVCVLKRAKQLLALVALPSPHGV